jgi:dihydroorotase
MRRVDAALEAIQEAALPLLLQGELTDPDVDRFDREAVFIEGFLAPLLHRLAGSKVIREHITTRQAAGFVVARPPNVGPTIAAHRQVRHH